MNTLFKNEVENIKFLSYIVSICQILETDVKQHVHGSKFQKLVPEGYTQWTDLHNRPETFTQMTGKGYDTQHA